MNTTIHKDMTDYLKLENGKINNNKLHNNVLITNLNSTTNGKFLSNNGSNTSWETVDLSECVKVESNGKIHNDKLNNNVCILENGKISNDKLNSDVLISTINTTVTGKFLTNNGSTIQWENITSGTSFNPDPPEFQLMRQADENLVIQSNTNVTISNGNSLESNVLSVHSYFTDTNLTSRLTLSNNFKKYYSVRFKKECRTINKGVGFVVWDSNMNPSTDLYSSLFWNNNNVVRNRSSNLSKPFFHVNLFSASSSGNGNLFDARGGNVNNHQWLTNITFGNSTFNNNTLLQQNPQRIPLDYYLSVGIDTISSSPRIYCWVHDNNKNMIVEGWGNLNTSFFTNDTVICPYISLWDEQSTPHIHVTTTTNSPLINGWDHIYQSTAGSAGLPPYSSANNGQLLKVENGNIVWGNGSNGLPSNTQNNVYLKSMSNGGYMWEGIALPNQYIYNIPTPSGQSAGRVLSTNGTDFVFANPSSVDLSPYALISSLNNYVLTTALNNTLTNYALTSTLNNYVLTSHLTSNYLTSAQIGTTLNNYATIAYTSSNYALSSNLNSYVLTTALNSTLSNYNTSAQIDTRFNNLNATIDDTIYTKNEIDLTLLNYRALNNYNFENNNLTGINKIIGNGGIDCFTCGGTDILVHKTLNMQNDFWIKNLSNIVDNYGNPIISINSSNVQMHRDLSVSGNFKTQGTGDYTFTQNTTPMMKFENFRTNMLELMDISKGIRFRILNGKNKIYSDNDTESITFNDVSTVFHKAVDFGNNLLTSIFGLSTGSLTVSSGGQSAVIDSSTKIKRLNDNITKCWYENKITISSAVNGASTGWLGGSAVNYTLPIINNTQIRFCDCIFTMYANAQTNNVFSLNNNNTQSGTPRFSYVPINFGNKSSSTLQPGYMIVGFTGTTTLNDDWNLPQTAFGIYKVSGIYDNCPLLITYRYLA